MRPTLYEFAGGESAFLALAEAHHTRCVQDPVLNHPFGRGDLHPQHVERLAAYWAEVLGGPPLFSRTCSDHSAMLQRHANNGEMDELGRRFVACFVGAMDDVGMPPDREFRAAMVAYMEWAVADVLAYPGPDATVPPDQPMPRWSWDGLQTADLSVDPRHP